MGRLALGTLASVRGVFAHEMGAAMVARRASVWQPASSSLVAHEMGKRIARVRPPRRPLEHFERYFYFVNSELADMSANPLEYRDRRDLIIEWRNR